MPPNSPAKERAFRLDLDSHSKDRMAWIRNVLTVSAGIFGIGFLFSGSVDPESAYSPGDLSHYHAHLSGSESCAECHQNAVAGLDTFPSVLRDQESAKAWQRDMDQNCRACHPVSEEDIQFSETTGRSKVARRIDFHSVNLVEAETPMCADCHREHKGTDFEPTKLRDNSCTQCHENLSDKYRISTETPFPKIVSAFDSDNHPEFRSLEADNGTIKFSHNFHMTPGLINPGDAKSKLVTSTSYKDPNGVLTAFSNKEGLIQLECHFCHQPVGDSNIDLREFISRSNETLSLGKYMSMPNYEQHCNVCHSVDFLPDQALDPDTNERVFKSAFEIERFGIEHGARPQDIEQDLKLYFAVQFLNPNEEVKKQIKKGGMNMLPRSPTRVWNSELTKQLTAAKYADEIASAVREIKKSCLHCHLESDEKHESGLPLIRTVDENSSGRGVYQDVWLKHGKFDHSSHREVSCLECHPLNDGKSGLKVGELDSPMITGLARNGSQANTGKLKYCVDCHDASKYGKSVTADSSDGSDSTPIRYAPADCTTCHSFHGGGNR